MLVKQLALSFSFQACQSETEETNILNENNVVKNPSWQANHVAI